MIEIWSCVYKVGSEIVTHRPGANRESDIKIKHESETTPHQQDVIQGRPNTSEGPYETPAILRTKGRAPSVVQVDDDIETGDSEIEREVMKDIMKRKKEMRVSSHNVVHARSRLMGLFQI